MKSLTINVTKKLKKKNLTVSFAESCTGGMLSSTITSVAGSSKIFKLGFITYSNQAKINILKVPKLIINKYGSVSKQCCLSMVKNLSKISKANISVAITGIAGPSGGTKFKPVGLVYIGVKKGNEIVIKRNLFKTKKRISIQKATVIKSLNLILSFVK